MTRPTPRRIALAIATALAAVIALVATSGSLALAGTGAAGQRVTEGTHAGPKPTIVLVHGAFADSSGWNEVSSRLQRQGYPVIAFSNPLRNPVSDGEYLRQFLTTVPGPLVLVGHSYGGAVITNGATGNPNVKALVYVAAYAPAEGESVAEANHLGGGHTTVTEHLVIRPYPGAPADDADAYIDPAWFHRLFAQDLPRRTTDLMAASQRPGAIGALQAESGSPAWEEIPSWYLVATQDRIIPPEAEAAMAERAGATTVEVDSSHVAMMSHPGIVAKMILAAARS